MTSVRFHPEARAELRAAVEFYRNRERKLGRELVGELRAAVAQIDEFPGSGTPHGPELRRLVLKRFPFSIVYRPADDRPEILAVIHHRRRPGYWRNRVE